MRTRHRSHSRRPLSGSIALERSGKHLLHGCKHSTNRLGTKAALCGEPSHSPVVVSFAFIFFCPPPPGQVFTEEAAPRKQVVLGAGPPNFSRGPDSRS